MLHGHRADSIAEPPLTPDSQLSIDYFRHFTLSRYYAAAAAAIIAFTPI